MPSQSAIALNPSFAMLVKLGSIVRHAEEFISPSGHSADQAAIKALLRDPDVIAWMGAADAMALLPVKR